MKTKIADIIIPEVFNPYVIEKTTELSALVASGIVQASPIFDKLASSGGKTINMPYFKDLTGDDEVLSDTNALTVDKITTGQDVAVILERGKSWSVNDLAKFLSGADPMGAIASLVAAYWARKVQGTLLKVLDGVFGAASMSGNVSDVSGGSGDAAKFTATTFLDACQKLGDAKEKLAGVVMHSATQTALAKQNLITNIKPSDGSAEIPYYQGKRVVIDDGCPVATDVYTTYLFGMGAIALGNNLNLPNQTETARDALAGDDILVNRRAYILHPRGVKFTSSSVAAASPTNAEMATADNWLRVWENKNIPIVKFVHKL